MDRISGTNVESYCYWRLSGAVTCSLCPRIFPPRCVGWPARTQGVSLASRAPARPWARQQGSGGGREGEPLRHTCGRLRGAAAAAGLAGTVGGGGSARRARKPARQRGCGDRGGGGRWQAGGGRRQALQEGIRSGGTPIRSPRTAQRLWLSGLSAPALLSTRAGDAGARKLGRP
jgi:hypothetical protein